MRRMIKLSLIIPLVLMTLDACGPSQDDLVATAIKVTIDAHGTQTAEALLNTPSPTPTRTLTATPELTPIPTIDFILGEYEDIEHGGFRYRQIEGFDRMYSPGAVSMSSEAPALLITLWGSPMKPDTTLQKAVEDLAAFLSGEMDSFSASAIYWYNVGDEQGFAKNFAGEVYGEQMLGFAAVAYHHGDTSFEFISMAPIDRWALDGEIIAVQVFESIEFFEPTPMENMCPVSTDPTYGYSEDNPIGVGTGDIHVGPSLERDYLDQLRGPRGETLEYVRQGSIDTGETIVDVYVITIGYLTETVTLYLDEYNLDPFVIPQGFTCAWSFK
jgi:hypothetical protein